MTTATTIIELRTTLLQVPWRGPPPAAGILSAPKRDIYVLEIETQGGLIGMSYLMPLRGGLHTLDACMKELIAPHVIGRDATEIEAIWQALYKSNFWLGRMGVTVFAQSAVDMALWDIVGKRAGLPLFRLWGAARTEVPAYGSGCFRGLGRDGMIARAKEFTAQGLKAIKMQVAHIRPWREDVQNVKAMREAMGGGIEIMIDVNMGWDADTAIQAGHRIDEFDPYWLEEPVIAEDFAGYRRIAAALKTRDRRRREPFHAQRPAAVLRDAVRADPAARPDARRLHRAAQDRGRRRAVGHPHRAASLPRDDGPCAGLDPQRQLPRIHGLERRSLDRAGAAVEERHDDAAGAAGPRPRLPAGDPEGLPHRRTADQGLTRRLLSSLPDRERPARS